MKNDFALTPMEVHRGRTCDFRFSLYDATGVPIAIAADDVVRFKLGLALNDEPLLDLDNIELTEAGSGVTIHQPTAPAEIDVRLAQDDTSELDAGLYFGELCIVDVDEVNPANAIKSISRGRVHVRDTMTGDTGAT